MKFKYGICSFGLVKENEIFDLLHWEGVVRYVNEGEEVGLSMEGSKPNWTDKTDQTDKNRANPTVCQFGFGFGFS